MKRSKPGSRRNNPPPLPTGSARSADRSVTARVVRPLMRWLAWLVAAAVGLQLYFLLRISLMLAWDPHSTAFQRAEAWRLATSKGTAQWKQAWVPYDKLPDSLKRAVIASEDDNFAYHDGIDWEALEKAWEKNDQAQAKVAAATAKPGRVAKAAKIVGGSTITQQLAKNLFLSSERTLLRKGQELVLTVMLETLLDKERILEIYLNSVEWGEGIFGAEAAAQRYYKKPAQQLSSYESARLAVMLPRPKYFEKLPQSGYLAARANVIVGRMPSAELP